ncbi:MAG: pantetheine-phosphate adenylyltransferase [Bacteroidaceae bacterium]|nr:pantetheine-phosphate adenylyltransferase [Bacteroidaceae bacterium]MBR1789040.1 pantetheine-phosphate adenylyltransferase [Bacteroidaceae bacterium]
MIKAALFPGSFDPFTRGHADIVSRGLRLFDHVMIAVGYNEQKKGWIPVEERVRALREMYKEEPRVSVVQYNTLTVDFARERGIHFILRGLRTHKDYEYELGMADVNRRLNPGIETVVLFSEPDLANISSSVVRELAHFGHDIQEFLPAGLNYQI